MSSKKPNFGRGYSVAHHAPKQTAMDKFAAAEEFVNGPIVEAAVPLVALPAQISTLLQPNPAKGSDLPEHSRQYAKWCHDHSYQPGTLIKLKLEELKRSKFNPRHFYSRQSISSLALNLNTQEQQQPIHVTPDYEGDGYFIVDGGRRVQALHESIFDYGLALIVDVPQGIASYKLGYDLNTQHQTQTVFDDAISWKQMLDDSLFPNQTALAEYLNVDKTVVSATLSISDLPTTLIEKMVDRAEQFGMNMAYNIVKFFRVVGEIAAEKLVAQIIADGLSVRKVAEITKKATENASHERPARTRYAERVEIRFNDDVQLGTLQTYADGRLELKLKGLSKAQTHQVQQRLQEVLAEFKSTDNADAGYFGRT